jgi:hypothetical protein
MDDTRYRSVLKKRPTQICRKCEIIVWLQETKIPFAEVSLTAGLLYLAGSNTASRTRQSH